MAPKGARKGAVALAVFKTCAKSVVTCVNNPRSQTLAEYLPYAHSYALSAPLRLGWLPDGNDRPLICLTMADDFRVPADLQHLFWLSACPVQ